MALETPKTVGAKRAFCDAQTNGREEKEREN